MRFFTEEKATPKEKKFRKDEDKPSLVFLFHEDRLPLPLLNLLEPDIEAGNNDTMVYISIKQFFTKWGGFGKLPTTPGMSLSLAIVQRWVLDLIPTNMLYEPHAIEPERGIHIKNLEPKQIVFSIMGNKETRVEELPTKGDLHPNPYYQDFLRDLIERSPHSDPLKVVMALMPLDAQKLADNRLAYQSFSASWEKFNNQTQSGLGALSFPLNEHAIEHIDGAKRYEEYRKNGSDIRRELRHVIPETEPRRLILDYLGTDLLESSQEEGVALTPTLR